MDVELEGRYGNGLFSLKPGMVHHIARDSERNLLPHNRSPANERMQFLITDGESFFHEERRDLVSEIECIAADALGFRVVTSDRDHRYRLTKEIISDPHQSCVLVKTQLEGNPEFLKKMRIYALLAPHLEVGGYGNSARRFKTAGQNVLIAWKAGKFLAMGAMSGSTRLHVATSDKAMDGRTFMGLPTGLGIRQS